MKDQGLHLQGTLGKFRRRSGFQFNIKKWLNVLYLNWLWSLSIFNHEVAFFEYLRINMKTLTLVATSRTHNVEKYFDSRRPVCIFMVHSMSPHYFKENVFMALCVSQKVLAVVNSDWRKEKPWWIIIQKLPFLSKTSTTTSIVLQDVYI